MVTLGVIVSISASAYKKTTTLDLQSRVTISHGLPRKAESQARPSLAALRFLGCPSAPPGVLARGPLQSTLPRGSDERLGSLLALSPGPSARAASTCSCVLS